MPFGVAIRGADRATDGLAHASRCSTHHSNDHFVASHERLTAMSFSRRVLAPATSLLIAAVATTFSAACKDKPAENAVDAAASTPPVASTATPMASAPVPATSASSATGDREARGAHGGPGAMLFQAARALELKDDQKAKIEAAEKAAHAGAEDASREALKTAVKDLHGDLVVGIKAGKIDTAKLEPRYAVIEKSAASAHEKDAAALVALHDALDATQRKAVTANVRAKQAAREEKMAHREGPDGGAAGADGGKPGWGAKRNVDRLTRGLELDAEQQKKIDAIAAKDDTAKGGKPDMAEMKKNVEALLVAFEKDTFDPKKLEAFDAKKARGPMEQEAKLLVQVVPILKPEQREKLAAKMEKGPSPHGRRAAGGGFGHRPLEEQDDGE
jgi:Spy/CpxP family protein refolding chaperone